jgi:hydroxyacylglutathione hydrolase
MPPALCGLRLIQERLGNSSSLEVFTVPCLRDNYAWIIRDVPTGQLAVVDTPSAKPIIEKLVELGIPKDRNPIILNTHHHKDHTGGNIHLKEELNAIVVGPKNEHIVGLDRPVGEGDMVEIGNSTCRVIDIPGHTKGHIGFVFDEPGMVFVGDTLFSHGCGALFEGSYSQMWKSLTKIMQLPPHYLIFCAHEYTDYNVEYALSIFRNDPELIEIQEQVLELRSRNEQTIPSLLEQELKTNPFLRCRSPDIQQALHRGSALDAFTCVREGKDVWRRGVVDK